MKESKNWSSNLMSVDRSPFSAQKPLRGRMKSGRPQNKAARRLSIRQLRFSANKRLHNFSFWCEDHEVGIGARNKMPLFIRDAEQLRRIAGNEADRLLQFPTGKAHGIAHGAIEGKHTAGQMALEFATVACDSNFQTTELIN